MNDIAVRDSPESKFTQVLTASAKLPGVRIDRAAYLRKALQRHCSEDQIARAIDESPARAGIDIAIMNEAANVSISYETMKVSSLSALAGIPGGIAIIGTIPADAAQYFGHILRIAQKLAYLYGWPDLFDTEDDMLDEQTESLLTLFVGVMFGVQVAQASITKLSVMIASQVAVKLPQQALTKGMIYPAVKTVSTVLGITMTKSVFANGIAKVIPIVGAVLSGGVSLVTFYPMSKRLQRHLVSLELTKPGLRNT